MKKIVLMFAVSLFVVTAFAQSEKYAKAMETNLASMASLKTPEDWTNLANNFQRIADAEKNQWLPYYYSALCNVFNGYIQSQGEAAGNAAKLDPLADKAEEMLLKAEGLSKDNSEIFIVKKMISSLRMIGDPMNRWQTQVPIGTEALAKAKSLNPENPRIYMLEGQDKFYTPEQFGGSKTEAKTLLEESMKKFESFKPESPIHPNWGKDQVKQLLDQLK